MDKLEIERRHIDKSLWIAQNDPTCRRQIYSRTCPIALAASEALGWPVGVWSSTCHLVPRRKGLRVCIPPGNGASLPRTALVFRVDFDERKEPGNSCPGPRTIDFPLEHFRKELEKVYG